MYEFSFTVEEHPKGKVTEAGKIIGSDRLSPLPEDYSIPMMIVTVVRRVRSCGCGENTRFEPGTSKTGSYLTSRARRTRYDDDDIQVHYLARAQKH